jgi:hypothetical protein
MYYKFSVNTVLKCRALLCNETRSYILKYYLNKGLLNLKI